jgi:hypothetical protein
MSVNPALPLRLPLRKRRHARSARLRYVRPQYLDPDLLVERWGAKCIACSGEFLLTPDRFVV